MKKNKSYWQTRFEQLENSSNRIASQVAYETEKMFQEAEKEIEQEISVWYQRFATNNNITLDDAKKLLKASELKELKWDINEYIKYGKENSLNPKWLQELENASAKFHISRLEALKLQTRQTIEALYNNEEKIVNTMVERVYSEGYYHSMYEIQKGFNIGWDIGTIDQNKLQKIISKPWATDGKNFSDRIWQSKGQLIEDLYSELTRTCILGKAPDDAIRRISKRFNTSKAQAGRLIMTEQAFFSSVVQKEVFNELDVEQYEIVATLDNRTSEICQDMDGHTFDMKDYVEGVTAPPFHPNCRTTTVPYFDDEYNITERAARDENGKTYYVPSNMTYKEWQEKFVENPTKIESDLKNTVKNDKIIESEIVKSLKKLEIEYNPVQKLKNTLTDNEIIRKISGGDMTDGSCSSVAFTYIANKNGLDVLDFRGGASQKFFSQNSNIRKISEIPGVKSYVEENYNDIKATISLLRQVEEGKQYYLATGEHAAIIRKTKEAFEYLELQSSKENGFKQLNTTVLKRRFGCKQSHSTYGSKFKVKNIMMEVDSFKDNSEFEEIMGYINTLETNQLKGISGNEK